MSRIWLRCNYARRLFLCRNKTIINIIFYIINFIEAIGEYDTYYTSLFFISYLCMCNTRGMHTHIFIKLSVMGGGGLMVAGGRVVIISYKHIRIGMKLY